MQLDKYNANSKSLNRKIINAFWIVGLIVILAEIVGVLITALTRPEDAYYDFTHNTLGILSLLIGIFLVTELIYKWRPDFGYFFVGLCASISVATILVHPGITGVQHILFVIIMGAAFYFEKKKIIVATVLCIVLVIILYVFYKPLQQQVEIYGILLSITLFIICMVLSIAVMTKGLLMMNYLKESVEEKQQLHIQKIITERMAKIDALTGLYNHKTFHEFLDDLLSQTQNSNTPMAMAIIDIDNFKAINDTFGHWVGDIVLRKIADCIRNNIHPNDFASRYGGEEFAILIIDQNWETSHQVAETLRQCISKLVIEDLKGHELTASIGLRPYQTGMSKEEWFTKTDQCLYEAKRTGKNKVVS